MGQEDLLIRIDERLKKVQEELERIETGLKTASSNVAKKFEDTDKILNDHSIEIAKNSMRFKIILSVFVTSALGGFAYLAKLLFGVKG